MMGGRSEESYRTWWGFGWLGSTVKGLEQPTSNMEASEKPLGNQWGEV